MRLRLTRPTDLPRIAAVVDGEARSRRFAFYDPRKRLAIAATRPGPTGEEIVGVAEVAVDAADRAAPEVVVSEVARHAGLRRLLAQSVTALALRRRR